jgi:Raf kinase inhibitor-like YbhB/YbcL family protein
MKKSLLVIAVITILAIILLMTFSPKEEEKLPFLDNQQEIKDLFNEMKLTSSAFEHNGNIPNKYSCNGDDINPPLEISGIPEGTQQLVLIMDDPDAVPIAGKVWDHWILFNMKPTNSINENSVPEGARQGKNGAGQNKYQGPCPPAGNPHHYHFKLYAVETGAFLLEDGAIKAEVEAAIKDHILAESELIGLYEKQ